ncbi:MAG: sulfatase [Candidatus Omnitrophica bacterium]|nr:sulfatase [Candidatus Omnitrophota bacterium]
MNRRAKKIFITIILLAGFCLIYFSVRRPHEKLLKVNIILITSDSLRADHLGCYGYRKNTSPCLDKISDKLTLYENCFSPASWTIPANYSMLTSLYPPQHNVISWGAKLDVNTPNILSFLYDNGYSIGMFGNHVLFLRIIKGEFPLFLDGYKEAGDAAATTSDALSWISSQKEKPFLAWVYYLNPHRPYSPPPPYSTLFVRKTNNKLPIKKAEEEPYGGWDSIPSLIAQNGIDNPDYYRAQYDGDICYLDAEVGRLLEGLKKMGLFDKSLIIFTSDHGESLGEHHLYFNHTFTLFNEVIRVPLLIKYPFQKKGRKVKENVSLIDIFPTILHQLGSDIFKHLEGKSLTRPTGPLRAVLSCYETGNISALICGRWKVIQYPFEKNLRNGYIKLFFPGYPGSRLQLFDIRADPNEENDVKDKEKQLHLWMTRKLKDLEAALKRLNYKSEDKIELNGEMMKKLKSLGYTQ